jgi:glycosyltransferase involved in cell wall biosynthesis
MHKYKLIYFSSKNYSSSTADALFVYKAIQAFNRILKEYFLFVLSENNEAGKFNGINTQEWGFKKAKFKTLFYFFKFPRLIKHLNRQTVVYSNEQPLIIVALFWRLFFKFRVACEIHGFFNWQRDRFLLKIVRYCDKIIATSENLRQLLVKLEPGLVNKIFVVRGGFDPEFFGEESDPQKIRSELNLPAGDFIIAYAGHLQTRGEKGVSQLIEAAKLLNEKKLKLLLVGGRDSEIKEYQEICSSDLCTFIPWLRDQKLAIKYLAASDLLVIPTSADSLYVRYSFPMKLYDYLALGKPILAADIPIIREVLNNTNSLLFKRGDAQSMAGRISFALSNEGLLQSISRQAKIDSLAFTWQRRAGSILESIKIKQ